MGNYRGGGWHLDSPSFIYRCSPLEQEAMVRPATGLTAIVVKVRGAGEGG